MQDKIVSLLKEGYSLYGAAKKLGIGYSTVRCIAIRLGLHKSKCRKIRGGRVVCSICKQDLDLNCYTTVNLNRSQYTCIKCEYEYLYEYQLKKLGCSLEQYEKLLKSQDGKCAICGAVSGHTTKRGSKAKLAVDHDHKTGEIRGLLCNRCNRGLGYLGEQHLERAVEYIRSARKNVVKT